MSAGFEDGWVELLDLNEFAAAEGTKAATSKAIEEMKKGKLTVFSGPYIGVNPRNPGDTIDLREGYNENELSSSPSFSYILRDCIFVEDD